MGSVDARVNSRLMPLKCNCNRFSNSVMGKASAERLVDCIRYLFVDFDARIETTVPSWCSKAITFAIESLVSLKSWKRSARFDKTGLLLDKVNFTGASRCGIDNFIALLRGIKKLLLADHSSLETDTAIISIFNEETNFFPLALISTRIGMTASPKPISKMYRV
jgi:hypothetical protein